ncbi:hypothetical protein [Chryseobacterium taklimakanense]|uniref:hypothetical protein n=1 Tax=Chryseobacterium taklimakanense TaxID=536441 RepID=UPI0023F71125|nr:hypothetical protein [Chryseobacterium taklimakanense]
MRLLFLFLLTFMLIQCNKNNEFSEQKYKDSIATAELEAANEKTYYYIMEFTIEDQDKKDLNERYARFNIRKREPISVYVSEVMEMRSSIPLSEDFKYKKLDLYEKYKLRPPVNNYIIIDRKFKIYNSYAEASKARLSEE